VRVVLELCANALPTCEASCRIRSRPSSAALAQSRVIERVVAGGQERSAMQHRALLVAQGFDLVRVMPTTSPLSLIEARPVPR